jgi:hypothetical protein
MINKTINAALSVLSGNGLPKIGSSKDYTVLHGIHETGLLAKELAGWGKDFFEAAKKGFPNSGSI